MVIPATLKSNNTIKMQVPEKLVVKPAANKVEAIYGTGINAKSVE